MSQANLRSLDLNLLVVLDRLLVERSVTGAARSLAMTQPAVSHALKRLRSWFGDDLLRRQGNAMALTARAEALVEPLGELLQRVRALDEVEARSLSAIERTLRLSMVDFAAAALLPPLMSELSEAAPGITIACLGWALPEAEVEGLQRGARDLVLTTVAAVPTNVRQQHLGEIDFVGLARPDHALFSERPRSPLSHRFVIVSADGRTSARLDEALAPRTRRVAASVPHYLIAPLVAETSDLLVYVPRPLARLWLSRSQLRQFSAPRELTPLPVALLWHRRHDDDEAHRFVREKLASIARRALVRRG